MKKSLIIIAGPTAVGKTDLSVRLAKHFSTEIISSDSRQFYREMVTGTAKPTAQQLSDVKHHFINTLSVKEDYNAGRFEADCIPLIEKLFIKHDQLIMTGGSGLYMSAVLHGVDNLPKADNELRKSLKEQFAAKGIESLQRQLKQLDPEYFAKADQLNPLRLMRAIEVCTLTGKKYSSLLGKRKVKRNFDTILIGLQLKREALYARINARVDQMIQAGLVDEVKGILHFKDCNAMQTVGYRELIQYFEGTITLEEAIELIKKNTRNYAKRQMTWFRKMKEIIWMNADDPLLFEECLMLIK